MHRAQMMLCRFTREHVRYMGYDQKGLRPKAFQIRERAKVLMNGIYSTEYSPFSGSRSIQFVLATLRHQMLTRFVGGLDVTWV